ncbi:MAG: VOC family protein [Ilumatobacteraceae bacterium]
MARVCTYLNFQGNTEEAFTFYKNVFGTEFLGPIMRVGDAPQPGMPELGEAEKKMVMHVALPIIAGHMLMGTDFVESFGHILERGNGHSIMVEPDTREEADALYAALSDGGGEGSGMAEMFWGDYWGTTVDRFGIRWMINHTTAQA